MESDGGVPDGGQDVLPQSGRRKRSSCQLQEGTGPEATRAAMPSMPRRCRTSRVEENVGRIRRRELFIHPELLRPWLRKLAERKKRATSARQAPCARSPINTNATYKNILQKTTFPRGARCADSSPADPTRGKTASQVVLRLKLPPRARVPHWASKALLRRAQIKRGTARTSSTAAPLYEGYP